jgi:hypothetical protein
VGEGASGSRSQVVTLQNVKKVKGRQRENGELGEIAGLAEARERPFQKVKRRVFWVEMTVPVLAESFTAPK